MLPGSPDTQARVQKGWPNLLRCQISQLPNVTLTNSFMQCVSVVILRDDKQMKAGLDFYLWRANIHAFSLAGEPRHDMHRGAGTQGNKLTVCHCFVTPLTVALQLVWVPHPSWELASWPWRQSPAQRLGCRCGRTAAGGGRPAPPRLWRCRRAAGEPPPAKRPHSVEQRQCF